MLRLVFKIPKYSPNLRGFVKNLREIRVRLSMQILIMYKIASAKIIFLVSGSKAVC